jgi:hypothetical protein
MHPGRVVTTFVAADGLCEMLMGTGVGQIVNFDNPTKVSIGGALIKVRLRVDQRVPAITTCLPPSDPLKDRTHSSNRSLYRLHCSGTQISP